MPSHRYFIYQCISSHPNTSGLALYGQIRAASQSEKSAVAAHCALTLLPRQPAFHSPVTRPLLAHSTCRSSQTQPRTLTHHTAYLPRPYSPAQYVYPYERQLSDLLDARQDASGATITTRYPLLGLTSLDTPRYILKMGFKDISEEKKTMRRYSGAHDFRKG